MRMKTNAGKPIYRYSSDPDCTELSAVDRQEKAAVNNKEFQVRKSGYTYRGIFIRKRKKGMKAIIVNTPQGQYAVPLLAVAEHRADNYIIVLDGKDRETDDYQNEVSQCLKDSFMGIDWIQNNSNWHEWSSIATKISDEVLVTEEDFWTSSEDFEIKEVGEHD